MNVASVAEVVWYVTGRFYSNSASMVLDVGYFLHVEGLAESLFADLASESTALLTFASAPFLASTISNGGLDIGVDVKGSFAIYLRETPGASFDDPNTFAAGQCVATFERTSIVAVAKQPLTSSNVFTARLVDSQPFDFRGARYDFRDLVGNSITQWGIAAAEPLTPPAGYTSVAPFVGSAIRAGTG
ncbi:MAG TPA: hypothetical protein VEK79_02010 [Thermoanaerobaculia bacterium]|nr:hypothetical protein [Thermoanaerobaculia bacterium]